MTNALTIFNQLRPHTIGYDDIFDHFNDMFESSGLQNNYPPYDIIKHSDTKYDIQVALAGYSKEDIVVEVKENTLSIKSVKQQEDEPDQKRSRYETDQSNDLNKIEITICGALIVTPYPIPCGASWYGIPFA